LSGPWDHTEKVFQERGLDRDLRSKEGIPLHSNSHSLLEISTQPLKKAGANFNSARGDSHGPWQENSQQCSQRTLLKIKSVRILNIPIGVTGILQEPVFLENEGQQMMIGCQ
jgi:hypothetical protein